MRFFTHAAVVAVFLFAGGASVAEIEATCDEVYLGDKDQPDWDMLTFTYCPGADVSHQIVLHIVEPNDCSTPVLNANPRIYFYNWQTPQSAYFCNDMNATRSEDFYATELGNGYYQVDFSLGGGVKVSNPLDNMSMMVQYGANWSEQEHFYNVVGANPDLNGDGVVNLSDIPIYSDFSSGTRPYDPRADFNHDGNINLTDTQFFSAHFNDVCP